MVSTIGYILLVPVVVLCALASSTLVLSSYSILLPILATAYEVQPMTALYTCFAIDFINGVYLSWRYGSRVVNQAARTWVFLLGLLCGILALFISQVYGINFIEHHKELSHAVGIGNFFIFILFLHKAYKLHQEEKTSLLDTEAAESFLDPDETEHEYENEQELDMKSFKTWSVFVALAVISSMSGTLGMGGGQVISIIWMQVFNWKQLPSIAVGSFISACLMLCMLISYAASNDVEWDSEGRFFAILIPTDIIAVFFSARYAESLSEKWLAFSVAGLALVTAVVVTIVVLTI